MRFPVSIKLHRSHQLSLLLVLFHAIAAGCVIVLPRALPVGAVLLVPVCLSLWFALRPGRIVGLRIFARDRLDCHLADDTYVAVKVLPDSTVFFRLIVLRLRIGEEQRVSSLTLLPDQMSAEQFRLVRLWLRWHAEPNERAGTIV